MKRLLIPLLIIFSLLISGNCFATTITVTNLHKYSTDLNNAVWAKSAGVTYTPATRVLDKSTEGTYKRAVTATQFAVAGTSVRMTVRAKAGTLSSMTILIYDKTAEATRKQYIHTLTADYADYSIYTDAWVDGNAVQISIYPGDLAANPAGTIYVDKVMLEVPNSGGFIKHVDTTSTAVSENLIIPCTNYYTTPFDATIAVGDSIIANGNIVTDLDSLTGYAKVTNYAVGGDGLAAIRAEFDTHCAGAVEACIINGGINDVAAERAAADMIVDMKYMIDTARTLGKIPIPITVLPYGSAPAWTQDRQDILEAFNTWLRTYTTSIGVSLVDGYTLLLGTGVSMAAAYDSGDGVHPTTSGRYVLTLDILSKFYRNQCGGGASFHFSFPWQF